MPIHSTKLRRAGSICFISSFMNHQASYLKKKEEEEIQIHFLNGFGLGDFLVHLPLPCSYHREALEV